MMQNQVQPHGKHMRFYIVMITLVLGGIFFLLVMNEKGSLSLTGSSIGLFENKSTEKTPVVAETAVTLSDEKQKEDPVPSGREVNVVVSSDQIPQVAKEAKIKVLEVHFTNDKNKIKVNNDQLELNNVQDVTLKLTDFAGEVDFDSSGLSLQGNAKRMEVNGLALAAKSDLSLGLSNVPFTYLFVDDIQLKNVILPAGEGQITVADKLNYALEQEELGLFSFDGKITVDQAAASLTTLEGVARGVQVSGALLNVDVH